MSSKADLKRLKTRLEQLERIEREHIALKETCADYVKSLAVTNKAQDEATALVDDLRQRLKEADMRTEEVQKQLTASEASTKAAQRAVERAKEAAKLEAVVREQQVKRLKITEHELETYKHEFKMLADKSATLGARVDELEKEWYKERSMRLKDLHRGHNMAEATEKAGENLLTLERNWLEGEACIKDLESKLRVKDLEAAARSRVAQAHEGEVQALMKELELARGEVLALKNELIERDGRVSAEASRLASSPMDLHGGKKGSPSRALSTALATQGHRRRVDALKHAGTLLSERGPAWGEEDQGQGVSWSTNYKGHKRHHPLKQHHTHTPISPSLAMTGSIYVGSGLGVRKETPFQGHGGSPKAMLESALRAMPSASLSGGSEG